MTRIAALTGLILPVILVIVGAYFTFTAVQGTYGLFNRIQIEAEVARLSAELEGLTARTARMEILTRRLSDDYLDLDLLDERVRHVLGYARPDELILP